MADILSTLRELRSLEEKRAHGTLSPGEEQRFQELQTLVSSRGPKPGPPTPIPLPAPAAPGPPPAAAAVDTEPPFVDADLTEDATMVAPAPVPTDEPTVRQAPPVEASTDPTPEAGGTVPMSAAELRQWTASFSPAGGETAPVPAEAPAPAPPDIGEPEAPIPGIEEATSVFSAPVEQPTPPATEWLAPTPLPASPDSPAEVPALSGEDAGATGPPEGSLSALLDAFPEAPPEAPVIMLPASTAESTQVADDAPMVWSDPGAASAPSSVPLLDDSWSASMAEIPAGETPSDMEPTRLTPAPASMDPTLADSFEAPPVPHRSSDSAAGVTSKRMTPIGEAFAAGESRVVVHMLGGVQKRGSLVDAHMNADFLELRLPNGEREMLSTAALKAVFFVVPIGQDVPKPVGDPVTVTLQDGHQLTGLSPDYQVGAVGFFLSPTDQRSRTAKIYIYAGAVKGIS